MPRGGSGSGPWSGCAGVPMKVRCVGEAGEDIWTVKVHRSIGAFIEFT